MFLFKENNWETIFFIFLNICMCLNQSYLKKKKYVI